VSGDGQTATPGAGGALVALAEPIVVAAGNGSLPVAGARVRFTVADGGGRLNGAGTTADVVTDGQGRASATWQVDSVTAVQQVRTELIDHAGDPFSIPVGFTASLLSAARTSYAPSDACPDLADAKTVQEAIDLLCRRGGGGPTADLPKVKGISWKHNGVHGRTDFLEGLRVGFDRPMLPPEGSPVGWFVVTIEYDRRAFEADPTEIFVRRINAQEVRFGDQGATVMFRPFVNFTDWVNLAPRIPDEVLCRVVLKSHVLVDRDGLALDGDFLRAQLPSGNGTPGGDFESWFTLRVRG
jgi:hypothetical protein